MIKVPVSQGTLTTFFMLFIEIIHMFNVCVYLSTLRVLSHILHLYLQYILSRCAPEYILYFDWMCWLTRFYFFTMHFGVRTCLHIGLAQSHLSKAVFNYSIAGSYLFWVCFVDLGTNVYEVVLWWWLGP